MKRITLILAVLALAVMSLVSTGCASKADVASSNISKEAEQFKVPRRIIFINGITDKYLMTITGYCSVETSNSHIGGSLEVTCKVGKDKNGHDTFKRDNLGLSDNVTYMVQQVDPIAVSTDHYTVLFRPQTIVPDIDSNP